ncbi:MAG: hypothetical protein JNG85_14955, partial [Spirochaetaceae bacterium]|nr:hypothetical protein [Spirochaetaceae bacterium]
MGLNLISFLAAFGIAAAAFFVARRGLRTAAARLEILADACFLAFALLHGLATSAYVANAGLLIRLAFAALILGYGFLVAYALAFPRWLAAWTKVLAALAVAAGLAGGYVVLARFDFIATATNIDAGFLMSTGRYFPPLVDLGAAVGLAAAAVHFW